MGNFEMIIKTKDQKCTEIQRAFLFENAQISNAKMEWVRHAKNKDLNMAEMSLLNEIWKETRNV